MAKDKKEKAKPISRKKEIHLQLVAQLSSSLAGLKDILGEKKFNSRVRKAARLLSAGIKEKTSKKRKPTPDKQTPKRTEPTELPAE